MRSARRGRGSLPPSPALDDGIVTLAPFGSHTYSMWANEIVYCIVVSYRVRFGSLVFSIQTPTEVTAPPVPWSVKTLSSPPYWVAW